MITLDDVLTRGELLSLDEFVDTANELLPQHLPEELADARVRERVSVRLVRYFTTIGLLDEPLKRGREARYTYRHLLQLLVARRLMAMGHATTTVKQMAAGLEDGRLEALLQGEAQFSMEAGPPSEVMPLSAPVVEESSELASSASRQEPEAISDALSYLRGIRRRSKSREESADASAPPSAPAMARRAGPEPAAPGDESGSSSRPSRTRSWTRIEVVPGLEVHTRDDFELPPSPFERDRLMAAVLEELKQLRKRRR